MSIVVNVLAVIGAMFVASIVTAGGYIAVREVQNRRYRARLEREQASDGVNLTAHLRLVGDVVEPGDHLDAIKDRIREENW
jgi:hypothetical protein